MGQENKIEERKIEKRNPKKTKIKILKIGNTYFSGCYIKDGWVFDCKNIWAKVERKDDLIYDEKNIEVIDIKREEKDGRQKLFIFFMRKKISKKIY